MSQEQVAKEFGDRRKNPAYRNGWGDGRFGPTQLFLKNSNLAEWPVTRRGCPTTGGIATGSGSARCLRTGTLPDTGLRFSFRRGRRKADTHETWGESSASFIFGQELENH